MFRSWASAVRTHAKWRKQGYFSPLISIPHIPHQLSSAQGAFNEDTGLSHFSSSYLGSKNSGPRCPFQPGTREPPRALAHTAARPVAGQPGEEGRGGVGKKDHSHKCKCLPLPGVRIVFQGGRRGEFTHRRGGTPQPSFSELPYSFFHRECHPVPPPRSSPEPLRAPQKEGKLTAKRSYAWKEIRMHTP